jgi:hypothetical protein
MGSHGDRAVESGGPLRYGPKFDIQAEVRQVRAGSKRRFEVRPSFPGYPRLQTCRCGQQLTPCARKRPGARPAPNHQISIAFGRRNGVSSSMMAATPTHDLMPTAACGYLYFICHEPSQFPGGGFCSKSAIRASNVIEGPSSGATSSAAANIARASPQRRSRYAVSPAA